MNVQPERGMGCTACLVKAEFGEAKFISVSKNLSIWGSRKSSITEMDD